MDVRPSFLEKGSKVEFAVLSIEEYQALRERLEDLEALLELRRAEAAERDASVVSLDEVEREMVVRTLAAVNNNRTRAAEILGISRRALYNKIGRFGM